MAASPRAIRILCVVVFALGLCSAVAHLSGTRPQIDFDVLVEAAGVVRTGGDPYPRLVPEELWSQPYIYPQAMAFAVIPLAMLPNPHLVWKWLNLGFILLAGTCMWRYMSRTCSSSLRISDLAGIIGVMLLFGPLKFAWRLGQFDLLVMALLSFPYLASQRLRPYVAGVAISLATMIKVSPALLVPAMTAALGLRFLLAFTGPIVVYAAALTLAGRLSMELYLFREVLPVMKFVERFPEHSLYRLLFLKMELGSPVGTHYVSSAMSYLLAGVLTACYLFLCFHFHRMRSHWVQLLALGIAYAHIVSPFLEPQHYTLTLVVLFPLYCFIKTNGTTSSTSQVFLQLWMLIVIGVMGIAFLPMFEISPTGWPGYTMLVTDILLILVAFPWKNSDPVFHTPAFLSST